MTLKEIINRFENMCLSMSSDLEVRTQLEDEPMFTRPETIEAIKQWALECVGTEIDIDAQLDDYTGTQRTEIAGRIEGENRTIRNIKERIKKAN